ncbi:MAG TPA: YbaK/EbsC family protein [Candidatus Aphodovivens avistercoris]|nr:YbaK/EbsC family protein [Candidatus Aphodovivens avistercoris]
MAIEKVRAYFRALGMDGRINEYAESSATVELAAHAAGCEPCRIAKTLSFLVDGAAVLVVAAGDARIANAKFKEALHAKATMIPADQVEDLVGHAVGGVCPFAVNEGVRVFLDESLRRFDTVFPAAGSSNSSIELSIPELERASRAEGWVDVCKGWE